MPTLVHSVVHVIWQMLAVAAGGAIGAVARFGIALLIQRPERPVFLATLITNIIGCFLIGVLYRQMEARAADDWLRLMVITGCIGAFTTFSTFSLESVHLIDDRDWAGLTVNVVSSIVLGLVAVRLGMMLGSSPSAPIGS